MPPPRQRVRIAAIVFASSTAALTWTIFVPLMVVHLERTQTSTVLIGVATSTWALPILLPGSVYPKIIRWGIHLSIRLPCEKLRADQQVEWKSPPTGSPRSASSL